MLYACDLAETTCVASCMTAAEVINQRPKGNLYSTPAAAICTPGSLTALAISQVYGGQPGSVMAVEPSLGMSRLGQQIQAARAQVSSKSGVAGASAQPTADIRWASSLPNTRSTRSRKPQQSRYRVAAELCHDNQDATNKLKNAQSRNGSMDHVLC